MSKTRKGRIFLNNKAKELLWLLLPFAAALMLCLLAAQSVTAEEGGVPIAKHQKIRVYRGVPYTGTLSAVDTDGGELTFAVVEGPEHGTLELSGATFVYTPKENRVGSDAFTFTATDEDGKVSEPACVKISVERSRSGVSYADMGGHEAATAAVLLADRDVFTGAKVGESFFFEPERSVSRGEFTAMALRAMELDADAVSVTGFHDDALIPAWAKGYAVSALRAGIIRGVGTEEGIAFRAGDAITLNEAAAVLNRLLDVTDVSLADAEESWSAQAVANLTSVSVIEAGRFGAEDMKRPLTRGEAAQLLAAAMTLAEEENKGFLAALFR